MNCRPLKHGLCWAGFFFVSLANFLVESQPELESRDLGVEDMMINEKLAKGLWYDLPLSSQTMEGVLALGHSRDMCKDLNSCQINTWIITLDTEHLLTAVKVTSMNGVSRELEELIVYIAKGEEEPETCGELSGRGITSGLYFVFCESPILGRIITIKARMKLVNEEVFQVQTGIKIYAVRKTTFEDQEIYIYNKLVTQIGVFQYFMAEFATDGNYFTEAIACYPCDGKTDYGYGWWQVDLGTSRFITRLEIYTSTNQFYANTLQQITVGVSLRNITNQDQFTKCGDFKEAYDMSLNSKIDVYCREPVNGRYVTITRQRIAKFRPDMIVLAEVRLFEQKNSHPDVFPEMPRPAWDILRQQLIIGEWIAVFLYGAKATQAGFLIGFGPELALDGDPNTCSVACGNCNGGTDLLGWWKVTLTTTYEIVAIELLSSRNTMEESNYLQEFEVVVFNSGNPTRCSEYRNRTIIPQGTQIFLVCRQAMEGNVIMIRRLGDSKFAREKLAIADIKIYSRKRYEPPPPPPPRVPPGRPARLLYLYTEQGGTFAYYLSDFAIDGFLATYSISCLACDGGSAFGSGWWKIDLERSRLISGVQLFPSFDEENGRSLLGVEIGISTHQISVSDSLAICGEVSENVQISHGSWITVICSPGQLAGRYVIVRKMEGARYKPDSVSIAEIRIYVTDGSEDYVGGRPPVEFVDIWVIHRYVTQEKWIRIDLIGLEATQSDTQSEFGPQLAIDGNIYTYSVACNPCSIGRYIGVAWWAVEFEVEFEVTAVEVVSAPSEFESNYLQEFTVRVGSGENGGQSSICAEYVNRTRIAISSVIVLQCKIPIKGMKLIVERLPNSKFRKEALAIAEIKIYSVKFIPVNPQIIIEEKIITKQWMAVPLSPGSFRDITKVNYKEILFTCGYCGIYVISYSVHILVVFSAEVSVVGIQITFKENFDPGSVPNFQVFVENTVGESDLCTEFKRGRNVISNRKLSLTCTQPEKGKAVLTKGTWTQRTQIVSSLSVYTLASDSRVVVTEEVIDMTRLIADQSSTPDNQGKASNAIDGNVQTLSKAYGTKVEAVAWWKVDMRLNYFVKGVFITSAMNQYESYHLQQFEILIITQTQQERICLTYMGSPFGPGDRKRLYCGVVMNGKYVMIKKRRDSYNKDVLTLAEVEIVVNRQASQNYPPAGPPLPPLPPPGPPTRPILIPEFPPIPGPKPGGPRIPGGPSGDSPWLRPLPPPGPIPIPGGGHGPVWIPGSVPRQSPVWIPGPVPGPVPGPSPVWIPGPSSGWTFGQYEFEFDPFDPSLPESQRPRQPWRFDTKTRRWYITYLNIKYYVKFTTSKVRFYHIPIPSVALDGFIKTCSKTCYGCNDNVGSGVGWWHYELPTTSTITAVELLACNDGIECLKDVIIGVSDWNTTKVEDLNICAETSHCQAGEAPKWMKMRCHSPVTGNYLIIIRKRTPSNGINALSIAEIRVKDDSGGYIVMIKADYGKETTVEIQGQSWENDPFVVNSPGYKNEVWNYDFATGRWFLVTSSKRYYVTISTNENAKYYYLPIAEAALDGYMKTCSKTCLCSNQNNNGHGWWHFQFPTVTTISEVQLISCYDGIECLQDIVIGVSNQNVTSVRDLQICTENVACSSGHSEPQWLRLRCRTPVTGRYLIIMRKRTPSSGISVLSIAEIKVKDQFDRYIDMIHAETFPLPDQGWTTTGNWSFGATFERPTITGVQTSWTFNKVPVVTGEKMWRYRTQTQTRVRTIGSQRFYKSYKSPQMTISNFYDRRR